MDKEYLVPQNVVYDEPMYGLYFQTIREWRRPSPYALKLCPLSLVRPIFLLNLVVIKRIEHWQALASTSWSKSALFERLERDFDYQSPLTSAPSLLDRKPWPRPSAMNLANQPGRVACCQESGPCNGLRLKWYPLLNRMLERCRSRLRRCLALRTPALNDAA